MNPEGVLLARLRSLRRAVLRLVDEKVRDIDHCCRGRSEEQEADDHGSRQPQPTRNKLLIKIIRACLEPSEADESCSDNGPSVVSRLSL